MRRKLFTFASAVSLMFCVATVLAWKTEWAKSRSLVHYRESGWEGLFLKEYAVCLCFSTEFPSECCGWVVQSRWYGAHRTDFAGFGFGQEHPTFPHRYDRVIPYWFLLLAGLVLPLLRILRWPARVQMGTCRVCGYDLRATPDRCPECGAVPAGDRV